jgi:hypothetical protein
LESLAGANYVIFGGTMVLPKPGNQNAEGKPKARRAFFLPALPFFFAIIVACDTCAMEFATLATLQLPYLRVLHLIPIIVPGACALIWLRARRTHPVLGWLIPVLVCYTLILAVPGYVESRIARIEVTRPLTFPELDALELALGAPVTMISNGRVSLIVAPAHKQHARAELQRLGILPNQSE